tara:strand:+ start:75 stop:671 length:597 start_codon:yes stop_codon:yes gene_type:complete
MGFADPKTDIKKSMISPEMGTVDARKGFEGRVAGGRDLVERDIATRRGDIRGRADAMTNMARRNAQQQARQQDRQSKFRASDAGQYGGAAYLQQLKQDKRQQARAMQSANAAGIDFEDKALSALNARSGALRGAAEAGDITGGGFPGIRAHATGLGAFAKGPKIEPKKAVVKTTKPKKETEPTPEGEGHPEGGDHAPE